MAGLITWRAGAPETMRGSRGPEIGHGRAEGTPGTPRIHAIVRSSTPGRIVEPFAYFSLLLLACCTPQSPPVAPQGEPDAEWLDAGPLDALPLDALPLDALPLDAEPLCANDRETSGRV